MLQKAPERGPFLYLTNHAKDLQPSGNLGVRHVWGDGGGQPVALQPHPFADEVLHERAAAGDDKGSEQDDPGAD